MSAYLNAEISAGAVEHNLLLLAGRLARGVKLCPAVKADAYGHGIDLLLDTFRCRAYALAVATADEAMELRRLGWNRDVLVLLSLQAAGDESALREIVRELIHHRIAMSVMSAEEAAFIARTAAAMNQQADVHVKIDSGMGRSGVSCCHATDLVRQLRAEGSVRLAGLFTHFASADEADKDHARWQLEQFQAVLVQVGRNGLIAHAANSAALIDLPQSHLDMVRPGIAVYGYQPSDEMRQVLPLRPAMRLTGRLMQVKYLPAGATCGYGRTYTMPRDGRVGLVPIGYGDGYPRCLSNRSAVRIAGQWALLRGRVSMDQIIVDLSDIPRAAVGDEVEIISNDPAAPNSVENLARLAGTIPYEITCRLGRRVRRTLVP